MLKLQKKRMGTYMLSKLSLKTKIIIFSIAALIGIGIVVSVRIENRKIAKNLEIIKNEEIKNAQNEEAKRVEEEALKKKQDGS